ncbi:MAG: Do family serine endopeptidase [Deltaproteobacteria bacterium]|nr:Do family serine endopeptidase [Deltaproteobacteria bacterium]
MQYGIHGCLRQFALAVSVLVLSLSAPPDSCSAAYQRENAVVRAVRKVSPAVVNISSEYEVIERSNPFFDFRLDPFFDSFFRDFFEPGYQQRRKEKSLGSGVIIDGNRGYILTNEHVIARSAKIKVVLNDERELDAELVGAAPDFDLAVLKITSDQPLPAVKMGDSDDLMIGETVIAIGNPFGLSHSVTTGVISALNRCVKAEDRVYRGFIQTDASINPGNSGGPLLNINGELIGINTAIYSKAQGIGFAIPINKAKRVIDDLIKYGEVHVPWIGVIVHDLDPKLAWYFNVPKKEGVVIGAVAKGSPADEAGLKDGDVIVAIGKKRVSSRDTYYRLIKEFAVGDTIPVTVWKNSTSRLVKVHSCRFPEKLAEEWGFRLLGIRVREICAGVRFRYRIAAKEGVIITEVRRNCYLDRIGAHAGDLIRKINEVVVKNVADYKKAVIKYRDKKHVVLLIERDNQQYYVSVELG